MEGNQPLEFKPEEISLELPKDQFQDIESQATLSPAKTENRSPSERSEAQSYVDKMLNTNKENEPEIPVYRPSQAVLSQRSLSKSSQRFTESQIISKVETVTERIANVIISNNWSCNSVFGHPDIIEIIPDYEGEKNVLIIQATSFLSRVH